MKNPYVYIKFTNAGETHNGFNFKTGLNIDTNDFNPDPENECGPYGLYFTDVHIGVGWLTSEITYVREVTLPENEPVVTLDDKYRAHRIILGTRHDVSKVSGWKWLVSKGIDITAYDNWAIRWASMHGHLNVMKYLASKGADVTARDNYAVRLASMTGHLDAVKYLVSKGADVTARDNAAVIRASSNGHLDVVKYLVSHGADVSAQNNYAVIYARLWGHVDVVKYLESKGARLPGLARKIS